MKNTQGNLAAPFPYFGGKSGAVDDVWQAFGNVANYVEPFSGSAAMLLGSPEGKRTETINDADGFVANFWRAITKNPDAVADAADWPTNEADLFARHSWLVRQKMGLLDKLHGDPEYYDAKIAGWWVWGSCNTIGIFCSGSGPWVHDGTTIIDSRQIPHLGDAGRGINRQIPHLGDAGRGINRQIPHLSAGRGINRQIPHLSAGMGINRQIPHLSAGRGTRAEFINEWFNKIHSRMRDVRVCCGDWSRVCTDSVTTRHGLTGLFLDPPYTKGAMDYAAGGTGGKLAIEVQQWCAENGDNPMLRIVLCGHAGEHDALLQNGWDSRPWVARKGYARTKEALENTASETLWCSPHCVPVIVNQYGFEF
jgi:DNA adenine methylase